MMPERTLSPRELNRATLARQRLLERAALPALDALERVAGLQAQIPNPPYIGLWTRLADFRRDDLANLLRERKAVRAALMRSTLHVVSAADYGHFRPVLQPALTKALGAFFGQRAKAFDAEAVAAAARPFIEAAPRTTGEIKAYLVERFPGCDGDALAYAARNYLPQVQTPPGGMWGSGSGGAYTTAEVWLGAPLPPADLRGLFFRYLAAFGPSSVADFQVWAGMTKLKADCEAFRDELRVYRDERGRELFDLPDTPLPPADTPAPVRFVPEYDNLLIAHDDRTRVIADADRPKVFMTAGRVRSTFLVEGWVRGAWKIERVKRAAALVVEPFYPLDTADRKALEAEGERLLRFVEDDAETFAVRFTEI
jgi:hypothetical protein